MRTFAALLLLAFSLVLLRAPSEGADTNLLPNPSFEAGRGARPDYWDGFGLGKRTWEYKSVDGERCVSIAGDGREDGWWFTRRGGKVQRNRLYQVSYWVREDARGALGLVMGGINLTRHYAVADRQWQRQECFLRSPDDLRNVEFRLAQKGTDGVVYFDNVAMRPAVAVYRSRGTGDFALGDGESIAERRYVAAHDLLGKGTSDCRFLDRYTAEMDHDRWVLNGERLDEVVYHHDVARLGPVDAAASLNPAVETSAARVIQQTAATVEVDVARCQGKLGVQVADNPNGPWLQIGAAVKPGHIKADVPGSLLPKRDIWVRLKSLGGRRIEVTGYRYSAVLRSEDPYPPIAGQTTYLTILEQTPDLDFRVVDAGEVAPGGRAEVRMVIGSGGPRRRLVAAALVRKGNYIISRQEETFWLAKDSAHLTVLPYSAATGAEMLEITYRDEKTGDVLLLLESRFAPRPAQSRGK
jgi:hypothetical protein